MMDKLLVDLADGKSLSAFSLDGQSVMVEDYLEVRPENRQALAALVRAGKLAVGPWYVQPDLFLCSGEALIRNLLYGAKTAHDLGSEPMKAGLVADSFGHPAIMPSLMRGFGIEHYIFSRGAVPEMKRTGPVFRWGAADGASVTATWQAGGYGDLAAWGIPWGRRIDGKELDREDAISKFTGALKALRDAGHRGRNLLFNNGTDHTPAQPVDNVVRAVRPDFPGVRFNVGTFENYTRAVTHENLRLSDYTGELRSGWDGFVLQGVYSSRMWIKQRNHECQRFMESIAEPVVALVSTLRPGYAAPFLTRAWILPPRETVNVPLRI